MCVSAQRKLQPNSSEEEEEEIWSLLILFLWNLQLLLTFSPGTNHGFIPPLLNPVSIIIISRAKFQENFVFLYKKRSQIPF